MGGTHGCLEGAGVSTDPLKVEITYQVDGAVLSLAVDEYLNVLEVSESSKPEAA